MPVSLLAGWLLLSAFCGFGAEALTLRSHSGQFIVRGIPTELSPFNSAAISAVTHMRLDPASLVVSCERIKDALLNELDLPDHWRGKIYISLHPLRQDNEPILIHAVHHPDGRSYHVEIPELVDRTRLINGLVRVLLAEIANRHAGAREAELPPWLAEGMAEFLKAGARSSLMLEMQTSIMRNERHQDPLRVAREKLRRFPPLTLNELNWPSEEQLAGAGAEVYSTSAHVFVHQLLRLKGGRACMRDMLFYLPEYLNWQLAFLRAFQNHFARLIDADKWWALNVVHITGRDFTAVLTRDETARQLDEILVMSVQVRHHPKELPLNAQVKFQSIIGQWEYRHQVPVISQRLNLLQALRLRASQDVVGLVDSYRSVLETYLQKRGKPPASDSARAQLSGYKGLINDTVARLDELDSWRLAQDGRAKIPIAAQAPRRDALPAGSQPGFGTLKP